MPPISPQGSRTGMVTWLVIFVILFVTSTILFIYENAEKRNLQDRVARLESEKADLVSDATVTGPEMVQLVELAKASNPPTTAVDAVLTQRRNMAKTITGQALPPAKVDDAVRAAVARATSKDVAAANVPIVSTAGLTQIVTALSDGVARLQNDKNELQNQLKAANDEKAQIIASRDAMAKEKDAQIAAVRQQAQTESAELAAYRQKNLGTVQSIEKSTAAALAQQQESNAQLASQLAQATSSNQKLTTQLQQVQDKLKGIRPGVSEPTIQKPDGRIVRVPDTNTVVIDLGTGDQIVEGMTFEVYDQVTRIPAMGDGMREGEMPEGKASIEVIRILPGFSECRVIRRKPGYGVNIGDLIANLVYDSTQKYNFVVYGDFDLNNDNRTETGDADVIKRLITMWGGKVTNEVNINTDFIVMGVEPKAEPPSPNDDAVVRQQKLEAQQAQEAYLNVLKQASQLNIPIMNQNRFLNFVGYRSQATR